MDAVQSLCASIAGPSSTLHIVPCWLLDFCALLCCAGRGGWTACPSVVLQSELVLHLGEVKWVSKALLCFRGEDLVSSSVGQRIRCFMMTVLSSPIASSWPMLLLTTQFVAPMVLELRLHQLSSFAILPESNAPSAG
jgi:hypothetical protein